MMVADDHPSESLAAYHEARAAGGAGPIVTEAAAVHPSTAPMHIMAFRGDCIPFPAFWSSAPDAVDGSRHRHRDVPHCGYYGAARVRSCLDSEVRTMLPALPVYPQLRT